MKNCTIVSLLFILPFVTSAQKKTFTHSEIFRGQFPDIFQPLPEIEGWVDDDNYIEVRSEKGNETRVSVNAITGKSIPYNRPQTQDEEAPSIPDARNVTLSPDGKHAAYTKKNNNLY